jgi:hypothetical protein
MSRDLCDIRYIDISELRKRYGKVLNLCLGASLKQRWMCSGFEYVYQQATRARVYVCTPDLDVPHLFR